METRCEKHHGRRWAQTIYYMSRESTKRSQLQQVIRSNNRITISLVISLRTLFTSQCVLCLLGYRTILDPRCKGHAFILLSTNCFSCWIYQLRLNYCSTKILSRLCEFLTINFIKKERLYDLCHYWRYLFIKLSNQR